MPIYGQYMSENDFLAVAAKFRFCSIFTDICSSEAFVAGNYQKNLFILLGSEL